MDTGMVAVSTTKSLAVLNSWNLEKYARFVSEPSSASLVPQGSKTGSWKLFSSSPSGQIKLSLLEGSHLMLYNGAVTYESFSLWNAKKWMKGITKGDSILFIHKINAESRRFRIKLAPVGTVSSLEMCRQCRTILSAFITFKEMSSATLDSSFTECSQSMLMDSSQSQTIATCPSLPTETGSSQLVDSRETTSCEQSSLLVDANSLAKSLLQQPSFSLGRAYAETNLPTSQLGPFIRLCLCDPNFPNFVEKVEAELNKISS